MASILSFINFDHLIGRKNAFKMIELVPLTVQAEATLCGLGHLHVGSDIFRLLPIRLRSLQLLVIVHLGCLHDLIYEKLAALERREILRWDSGGL